MVMTEKMSIQDLPRATVDVVSDYIAQFTVALNRVFEKDGKQDTMLLGAGTLVNIDGLDCILTADHVLAAMREGDKLSLMTSFAGRPSGHQFMQSHLNICRIPRGKTEEAGPDIGLIVLPQNQIGALRSEKIFFNISLRADRYAGDYRSPDFGFWFNCGFVGETEQNFGPAYDQPNVRGYEALCGASANPAQFDEGEHDYLEVRVEYDDRADIPRSFGGMSGGGLWQVIMGKTDDGAVIAEEYILSGVTFFQTEVKEGWRRLRCHGRKSIYEFIPSYVNREISRA